MKKFIYVSDFKVGPEATKKQNMLFFTDLAFAISEGYDYIQSKEGPVFRVVDENHIVEVEVTEEDLQAAADTLVKQPTKIDFGPDGEDTQSDYCVCHHNLLLIDQVINNTLRQKTDLREDQIESMLKLAQLKYILGGM